MQINMKTYIKVIIWLKLSPLLTESLKRPISSEGEENAEGSVFVSQKAHGPRSFTGIFILSSKTREKLYKLLQIIEKEEKKS